MINVDQKALIIEVDQNTQIIDKIHKAHIIETHQKVQIKVDQFIVAVQEAQIIENPPSSSDHQN